MLKARRDLAEAESRKKNIGEKVDQSLEELKFAAAKEGATMDDLEKEMTEKMILQQELEEKADEERKKKAAEAAAKIKNEIAQGKKQPVRPMTSDGDREKKTKLQAKFDKIKDKV